MGESIHSGRLLNSGLAGLVVGRVAKPRLPASGSRLRLRHAAVRRVVCISSQLTTAGWLGRWPGVAAARDRTRQSQREARPVEDHELAEWAHGMMGQAVKKFFAFAPLLPVPVCVLSRRSSS